MSGQQAAVEVDNLMEELERRRTKMAEKRAQGIRLKEPIIVEDLITPGTQIITEGVISASSHIGTVQIEEWLEEKARRFATQTNFNDSLQPKVDKSLLKHLRLAAEWDVQFFNNQMFWRLPVGELFYCEERPSDLDLILKWYERYCPERSVHINTGIQITGDNDHSLTVGS